MFPQGFGGGPRRLWGESGGFSPTYCQQQLSLDVLVQVMQPRHCGEIWGSGRFLGLRCPPPSSSPSKLTIRGPVTDHQVSRVPLEVALDLLGCGGLGGKGGKWGLGGGIWGSEGTLGRENGI